MLTHGVPLYRLPRELVQAEIDAILSLGVELRLNTRVGTPGNTLADLKAQGFAAFYLGAGLQVIVVNTADQFRLRKVEFVIATINKDAFAVQQRAHGPVTQDGYLAKTRDEIGGHDV